MLALVLFRGCLPTALLLAGFGILFMSSSADEQRHDEKCPTGEHSLSKGMAGVAKNHHNPDSMEFIIVPKNVSACQQQNIKLRFFFLGDNSTEIIWSFRHHSINGSIKQHHPITIDGKKFHMISAEEEHSDDYFLFICDLSLDDTGWYTVELINKVGSISRSAFVAVDACNLDHSSTLLLVTDPYLDGSTNQPNPLNHSSTLLLVADTYLGGITSQPNLLGESWHWSVLVVASSVCIVSSVVIAIFCCRKRKHSPLQLHRRMKAVNANPIYNQNLPEPINVVPPPDPLWEINQESLHLENLLGVGAFGKVFLASYIGCKCPPVVAVKMLKDDCTYKERTDFLKEIEMMKVLGRHTNVISFYGYSVTHDGFIQVVVEFSMHGNLRDFLRLHDPSEVTQAVNNSDIITLQNKEQQVEEIPSENTLNFRQLASFSFQVARGMEYISSKKILHRDLAARNILVAEGLVLKIADFGLTRNTEVRNYYQRTSSGLLPIMWMAPESLADNRYTIKSDVWSFGVLLWEIFSFGEDPHFNVAPEELLDRLVEGYRMMKPVACSNQVAELMFCCWNLNPVHRPDFSQLVQSLDQIVASSVSVDYLTLEHLCDEDTDTDEVFQRQPEAASAGALLLHHPLHHHPLQQHRHHQSKVSCFDSQYASGLSNCHLSSSLSDNGTLLTSYKTDSMSQESVHLSSTDDINFV